MRTRAQAQIEHDEECGGPQGVIKKVRLRITRSASKHNHEPADQQPSDFKPVLKRNARLPEEGPRRSTRSTPVKGQPSEDHEEVDTRRRTRSYQRDANGQDRRTRSRGGEFNRNGGSTRYNRDGQGSTGRSGMRSQRVRTRSIRSIDVKSKRGSTKDDDTTSLDETSARTSDEEVAESSEQNVSFASTEEASDLEAEVEQDEEVFEHEEEASEPEEEPSEQVVESEHEEDEDATEPEDGDEAVGFMQDESEHETSVSSELPPSPSPSCSVRSMKAPACSQPRRVPDHRPACSPRPPAIPSTSDFQSRAPAVPAKRSPLPVQLAVPTAVRTPLPLLTAVRTPLPLPSATRTPLPFSPPVLPSVVPPPPASQLMSPMDFPPLNFDLEIGEDDSAWLDSLTGVDLGLSPEPAWRGTPPRDAEMSASPITHDTEPRTKSGRAVYRCSKCGEPKKGHKCPLEAQSAVPLPSSSRKRLMDAEPNEPAPPKKIARAAAPDDGVRDSSAREFTLSSKWLLDSRVLEGQNVRYVLRTGELLGTGVVRNAAILCNCADCDGQQSFYVTAFEKHVGSIARHPSDNIFLDNGRCLRKLLEAASKYKNKSDVMKALRAAVSPEEIKCGQCSQTGNVSIRCSREACFNMYHEGCASAAIDPAKRWCRECVMSSRETREAGLHKSLFLAGGLAEGTDLGYYSKGQCYMSGVKEGPGIRCRCCGKLFNCSQFEVHAGWGCRRDPYNSIYLSDGRSLHQVAMSLPAHGTCCLKCGRGGNLLVCKSCSEAYHEGCAEGFGRSEDWVCGKCQNASDRKKLTQVKAEETTLCGCSLCRIPDFKKGSEFGPMTMMICDQCEREFHVGCLREHGLADLHEVPNEEWFCGSDCQSIHRILNLLLFTEETVPKPLASSVLEKLQSEDEEITWQLLHGKKSAANGNGNLLSDALAILSSGFAPIVDPISGQNQLSLMVHSQSIRDQEFGGMYCIVLKHGGNVVSAAVLRVFGKSLAEMPLVATKKECQGKGYFQTLFGCIEMLLGILNVEQISLPAADGAEGIWLNKFGFTQMPKNELQKFREELQLTFFAGSSVLKKAIVPLPSFPLANLD